MRIGRTAAFAVLLACHGGPARRSSAEGATPPTQKTATAQPTAATVGGGAAANQSGNPTSLPASSGPTGPPSESYFDQDDLQHLAAKVTVLKKGRLLVCGSAPASNCVCVEPLPCDNKGNCVGFTENVDAFRRALTERQKGTKKGTTVDCRRAEVGTCGGFKYFDFEGDVERRELRWFDATGRLVAQRNSTDYEEYCGGKARTRLLGRIPRCEAMKREDLICGTAEAPLITPLEEVLKRLMTPAELHRLVAGSK